MKSSVLIIGSGLAGLATAYRLAERGVSCVVVTKDEQAIEGSNSVYAQGGIVYRPSDDSPKRLERDILAAGDDVHSPQAVEQLATDGIDLVREVLIDGAEVPFDRSGKKFSFTREAAHSRARILHVKDQTGRAIMESLYRVLRKHKKVTFLTGHVLVDLLTSGHNAKGYRFKYERNRCLGAYLFDLSSGKVKTVLVDHTVLCTGGVGQVYLHHTNAEHAYGSGLAAANRARVRIINTRFVQFHPTALWEPGVGRKFLISEALRGEGARLQNKKRKYLLDAYPQKDLESRAVISRVIMEELQKSGASHVYLNLADHYRGSVPIPERFPAIYKHCLSIGIDISREPIPVVPAEHFFCGGIAVDLNGRSEMEGLYAAGEVACTGVHGANRLASTSLLECLTWGVKAAEDITQRLKSGGADGWTKKLLGEAFALVEDWHSFGSRQANVVQIERQKNAIRKIMWDKVGILRSKEKLFQAQDQLRRLWKKIEEEYTSCALSEPLIELRHMIETAHLITRSACSHTNLMKDSMGGHVLVK